MGLGKMLNWSQTTREGIPRSTLAKIVDPVGVCIEPAALDPFIAPEAPQPSDSDDVVWGALAGAPPAQASMDCTDHEATH